MYVRVSSVPFQRAKIGSHTRDLQWSAKRPNRLFRSRREAVLRASARFLSPFFTLLVETFIMFWRFGFQNPSAIDTLLDREDIELEDILEEEDLLQEAKSHNQKLVDLYPFFTYSLGKSAAEGACGEEE